MAAVFGIFALFILFNAMAWFFNDLLDVSTALWAGFLIVFLLLVAAGALCTWLAIRFFQRGAPPTPDLAIEEAKRTRVELERATESPAPGDQPLRNVRAESGPKAEVKAADDG